MGKMAKGLRKSKQEVIGLPLGDAQNINGGSRRARKWGKSSL